MPSSILSKASTTDVLSDIPLLFEGVMGIGIFTFLVVVKKVCRLCIYLHASSFLTFVAATLDLSRAAGGHMNAHVFTVARAILLSLAYLLVNLYLWELVAMFSRKEAIPVIVGKKRKRHGANLDQLGLLRKALRWISFAALLTVPALRLVWRLVPTQRQHPATYVVDSILGTTLPFVFILEFIFNAYGSLSKPFWQAIRPNVAPILSLLIDIGLNLGNLSLYDFTDSPLGCFLHAVGIYILLLYNLFLTFQDFVESTLIHNTRWDKPVLFGARFLGKEIAQTTVPNQIYRRPPFRSRLYPWMDKYILPQDIRRPKVVKLSDDQLDPIPRFGIGNGHHRSSSLIAVPPSTVHSPSPSIFEISMTRASTPVTRPDSPILTGSLLCFQGTQQVDIHVEVASPRLDGLAYMALNQDIPQNSGDSQSISSLDKILRHRDEVEKSIAALRELSPPCSVFYAGLDRSPTGISSTSARSNNSIFSLSVFPDPPSKGDVVHSNEVEIVALQPSQSSVQKRKKRFNGFRPLRISGGSFASPEMLQPASLLCSSKHESAGTQWDVTSFIGNLMIMDRTGAQLTVDSMYGVQGSTSQRISSQLIPSPVLKTSVLCPAEGNELLRTVDDQESRREGRLHEPEEACPYR